MTHEEPARSDTDITALERFVVENDDLLQLELLIGRFNIFDALNISRVEIRHSNFLAFILDPSESHGQSQLFLRGLLMDLLKAAPPNLRPLSPIEIEDADLRTVDVRREWNNIDLLITARDPALVVAIENKVESGEHSGQLARYKETVRRHFPTARPLYVFLTPDESKPSDDEWVPYGYPRLHKVLHRVRATYENAIGNDVRVFLDHYLRLIGTRFMNDPKIDELCRRIYKNHRQALQLIYERVGTPASGTAAEVEACLRDDPRLHVFYRSGDMVDFVPREWMDWLPPLGADTKDHPESWFVFRFHAFETQLDFYIEVRRMSDSALRRSIVEKLLAEGDKFGFARRQKSDVKIGDYYTRVSSRERVLAWQEDNQPDTSAIRSAVTTKLDVLCPKLVGLPAFLQGVLGQQARQA